MKKKITVETYLFGIILLLIALIITSLCLGAQGIKGKDKFKVMIAPAYRVSKDFAGKPLIKDAVIVKGRKTKYKNYIILVRSRFPQVEKIKVIKGKTWIYLKHKNKNK